MLGHHDDHDVDLSSPGMSAVSHIDSLHHHHHHHHHHVTDPDHLHLDMTELSNSALKSESSLHHTDDHIHDAAAAIAIASASDLHGKDKPARVTREQCRHTCGCAVVTVGRSAHERVDSIHPLCTASCPYYGKLKPISEEFAMKRYAAVINDKTAKITKRDYTPLQCRHSCGGGCTTKTVGRSAHERVRSKHANCDSRCAYFSKLQDKIAPEVAKERLRQRNRLYLRERCRHTCGCNMNTVGRSHHERIKSRHLKCDPSCAYFHKLIDKTASNTKSKAVTADGAEPHRWRGTTPQQCRHQCGCIEVVAKRSQHERNIRAHPDCAPANCTIFERMTNERNRPRKKKSDRDDDDDDGDAEAETEAEVDADADVDAADEAKSASDVVRDVADVSGGDHGGGVSGGGGDHISFEFSLIDSSLTAKAAEAAAAAAAHADMETFSESAILHPHSADDDDNENDEHDQHANRKRNRRQTDIKNGTETDHKRIKAL